MIPNPEGAPDFIWIEDLVGVECRLDRFHRFQLRIAVLDIEKFSLGEADSVFAGDDASEFDHSSHHLLNGLGSAIAFIGLIVVIHDMDMKISVGGMAVGWSGKTEILLQLKSELKEFVGTG